MFDREMIKKMLDVGIESDKILALMLDAPAGGHNPPEGKQLPQEPKPPEEKQLPQEPNPPEVKQLPQEPKPPEEKQDAVLAAIEKLTGTIAAANIRHIGGPGTPRETAKDILARVIMNKPKEEE